jgi:hypothetical protein
VTHVAVLTCVPSLGKSCKVRIVGLPSIDRLYPHLDPDTPLVPEGSAEIPLRWGGVLVGVGGMAAALGGGVLAIRRLRRKFRGKD